MSMVADAFADRTWRPKARTADLVIERMAGETLVYDLTDDSIHHLSPIATAVWSAADGGITLDALVAGLSAERFPEHDVVDAVHQLADARLFAAAPPLAQPVADPRASEPNASMSRRSWLRRAGFAAAVTTMAAPTAAMAASACGATNEICSSSTQCCSGCCSGNLFQCKGGGQCLP